MSSWFSKGYRSLDDPKKMISKEMTLSHLNGTVVVDGKLDWYELYKDGIVEEMEHREYPIQLQYNFYQHFQELANVKKRELEELEEEIYYKKF